MIRSIVRLAGIAALASVALVVPRPAAADLVLRDAQWPSVGPGSDGSLSQPELVEIDVPEAGVAVLPRASLAPAPGVRGGPRTPPVTLGFGGVDGTMKDGTLHKPPDTHVTVGSGAGALGRVVMVTNSGIQIWDKTGAALTAAAPLDTFLGTPVPSGFDPKVLFDQHSGRFFIVVLEGKTPDPGGTSNVHIAVSTASAPSNLTTDWTKLAGSALTNIAGAETFFDYPGIAADAGSLFVTGNMFDASGFFRGVKIRVFDKAALLAGIYGFVDLDVDESATPGSFTIQPAHVYGATDNGNFYLVNRVGPTLYRLWEIAGAPAAPVLVSNAPRIWASGSQVSGARQAGTPVILDTVPGRIMNAVYRAGHVWLTLSGDVDQDFKTEVYWAQIATNGGAPAAPAVADAGYVDGSDGDEWTFMPSISVNAAGDVTLCYTQSFSDQFPDMRVASRAAADPGGFFQAAVVAATSPGFYDAFFPFVVERWGDYSATVVDPDDDMTFWAANEITLTSGVDTSIWNTFIARLGPVTTDPNPPTPTPTPPPPVAAPIEAGGLLFTGEVHSDTTGGGSAPGLTGPMLVELSPDDAHVYTGSRLGILTVFQREPATGALTFITPQFLVVGNRFAEIQDMAFNPDGVHLYVLNVNPDESVLTLTRDPSVGFFTAAQNFAAPDYFRNARDLAVSPDGEHVYVADFAFDPNGAIVALEVDDGTGAIAGIVQTLDLLATDERLRRAEGIALSPDGAYLYVVGRSEDAIGVFSRNATTGELTHVQTLQQGVDGVDGLQDVNTVAISADGEQVFTALSSSNFIGVFDRDPGTGELTFVEILKGGVLKDVSDLDSSPDGRHIYVADRSLPGVSAFLRLPSGRLGFLGQHVDGKTGVGGLTDTLAAAVSADGRNLYSVSNGEQGAEFGERDVSRGALVTFVRDQCGSMLVTGAEQCDDGNVAGGDGCDAECTLELCGPAPAGGCRTPVAAGGAQLKLKKKDLLVWKWGKGPAIDVPDFGDPLTAASYLLCLYDSSGGAQPLRALAAPASGTCAGRPCWAVTGSNGFKYRDKQRTPDGLLKTQVKAGIAGNAKANVKGKGALLALPALPLVPPVTAQLVNDETGVCWSATFSAPLSNTADQFKAKSD